MRERIKVSASSISAPRRFVRFRPRVWASLLCLLGLGIAANGIWRRAEPGIARRPQYRLTADKIHITPPPPWIRSDIKAEVLRDAGLAENLTLLDDWAHFTRRIQDAFEFHPWVASVERIRRRLPSSLEVELKYRRPVAAVESTDDGSMTFLPIDEHAIRLPEGDLTDVERRYLPRISGVVARPLVGDVWNDPRIVGGAKLAAALVDVWQRLRLVEIIATLESSKDDDQAVITFEIVTSGGTRVIWGAPPGGEAAAGESPLETKRKRLLDYAAQHGKLETIDGPAKLDVRSDLIVTPRTARRESNTKRE
jgi:hypothetical protein